MKLRIPFVSSIASAMLAVILLVNPVAGQAAGGEVPLDRFPTAKLNDPAALQNLSLIHH